MADLTDEAREFLRLSMDAESTNRQEALADLRFVSGEQWPVEMQNSRNLEARPCLTINLMDGYCRQVSNQQRQQRPRIKVHAVSSLAEKKIADVIEGLVRHIEVNSDADTAYDTAFDYAVKMGWGYWRVVTDYIREDSFDQDIYLQAIENPFTVYFDPNSVLPDGSDQEKCLVTDLISKEEFRWKYPGADDGSNFQFSGAGDDSAEWVTKEDIRVAEFFRVTQVKSNIVMLSNRETVWADELPPEGLLKKAGLAIVGDRSSFKRQVKWAKVTGMETLEERDWPGRWIPIIPTYGNLVVIGSRRKRFGIVRYGKDPARMVNYWNTAATESIALAPKAKWTLAAGQDEGYENEWARANLSSVPILHFNQTDVMGQPAPPPQRIQPEPPPVGMLQALQIATGNLREVIGVNDPAMRVNGNVSGKALNAEKQQSDNSTFHYYDNLTRSIKHTGRIILDLIPKIYDSERVSRIIGDDGQPDMIVINGRKTTAEGEVIENNVTVGQYDVIMDTGPGYNSKRLEAVDAMAPLMQNEELMKVIGDLYFRNSDFPGAEVIADRLAAQNPLAQIDEKSDIPPAVQMQMKQMQQMVQQLQQQLQAAEQTLKTRSDLKQMEEAAETNREHMRLTVKAHDIETSERTKRHDVESQVATRAHDAALAYKKAMDVEEIRAHLALLLTQIDKSSRADTQEEAIENAV